MVRSCMPASGNGADRTSVNKIGRPRRQWCARLTIALAVAGMANVGACSSGAVPTPAGEPTSTARSRPSPSDDPKVTDAEAKAVAVYQGYVAAYARAAKSANVNDPDLPRYIGGGLLSLSQHDLRVMGDNGAVQVGAPTATVMSTTVDLAGPPPTVTIQACVDYSSYRLVYKSNQSPVPNSTPSPTRYTTTATVSLYSDGRWRVSQDVPHRDTPC